MELGDFLRLVHPAAAVVFVFPLIGMVVNLAWQTRQRRIQSTVQGTKSKIPPVVGPEHVKLGRWLTGCVVGVTLLGLTHPIFKTLIRQEVWGSEPVKVIFIVLMFVATIASLAFLYKAKSRLWRGIFATLCGMGLVILGAQDGVYRRSNEWFISHYYYGIAAALLMVVSLAVLYDIYKSAAWRRTHVFLNCIALLLFLGQGMTGVRDLLEIPLGWQEPFIYQCNFEAKVCGNSGNRPLGDRFARALPAEAEIISTGLNHP
ncbi:MAG: DUF4079 domain-containing protein [Cyanothece sp. SIO1E1]|nr:DUF4079 domain-containing protein [Cyanothece sp. SIO1E1]